MLVIAIISSWALWGSPIVLYGDRLFYIAIVVALLCYRARGLGRNFQIAALIVPLVLPAWFAWCYFGNHSLVTNPDDRVVRIDYWDRKNGEPVVITEPNTLATFGRALRSGSYRPKHWYKHARLRLEVHFESGERLVTEWAYPFPGLKANYPGADCFWTDDSSWRELFFEAARAQRSNEIRGEVERR